MEGLVGSWRFCSKCGRSNWFGFVDSTSLTIHGELDHIIVASHHMFTATDCLTWVNVGGGCYKVVSNHGFIIFGCVIFETTGCYQSMVSFFLDGVSFPLSLCDI